MAEKIDESYAHRGRRAEAGPRRRVRVEREIDPAVVLEILDGRLDEVKLPIENAEPLWRIPRDDVVIQGPNGRYGSWGRGEGTVREFLDGRQRRSFHRGCGWCRG